MSQKPNGMLPLFWPIIVYISYVLFYEFGNVESSFAWLVWKSSYRKPHLFWSGLSRPGNWFYEAPTWTVIIMKCNVIWNNDCISGIWLFSTTLKFLNNCGLIYKCCVLCAANQGHGMKVVFLTEPEGKPPMCCIYKDKLSLCFPRKVMCANLSIPGR